MTGTWRAGAVALALAAVLGVAGPATAQPSVWRPADRLIIGDLSTIAAVAAGRERAYAVTPDAVLVLDPRTRAPLGRVEAPAPGALRDARLALVDPLDESLWIAGRRGWLHLQPDIELWEQGALPGEVTMLATDATDPIAGVYFRVRGGWYAVPRGGFQAEPTRPPRQPVTAGTLEEAMRENPILQGFSSGILMDGRRTPARYTSASRTDDRLGWFIGTDGLGLLWLPTGANLPERLTVGLPTPVVGALFVVAGGVWVATEPQADTPGAVAWVAEDGATTRSLGGPFDTGFDFRRAWDLAGSGRVLWVATDIGLLRVPTTDEPPDLFDEGAGLPDRSVHAVVAWRDTIFVATRQGVARVRPDDEVERLVPGFPGPAHAVAVSRESLWVGTNSGPFTTGPDGLDLVRLDAPDLRAELREPVIGFAHASDTLVALTRRRLLLRDPGTGAWSPGPDLSGDLGRLTAIASDDSGFWVAGERGVGHVLPGGPVGIPLRVPGDIPAAVRDVGVDDEWLWVGTEAGLVRFRLEAVGR